MSIHILWRYFKFRLVLYLWQLYADVIGSKLVSTSPKTLLALWHCWHWHCCQSPKTLLALPKTAPHSNTFSVSGWLGRMTHAFFCFWDCSTLGIAALALTHYCSHTQSSRKKTTVYKMVTRCVYLPSLKEVPPSGNQLRQQFLSKQ